MLSQAALPVQLGTICSADALLERRFCRVPFAILSCLAKFSHISPKPPGYGLSQSFESACREKSHPLYNNLI